MYNGGYGWRGMSLDELIEARGKIVERDEPKNDCGKEWDNLPTGCIRCNGGPHGHYQNGSCDTEPCVIHGGPQ